MLERVLPLHDLDRNGLRSSGENERADADAVIILDVSRRVAIVNRRPTHGFAHAGAMPANTCSIAAIDVAESARVLRQSVCGVGNERQHVLHGLIHRRL